MSAVLSAESDRLAALVNADVVLIDSASSPVMATPAAFGAGVVAGAKATGALVAAAGAGAAVGSAVNGCKG